MSDIEKLRKALDEIDEKREELRKELCLLGLKKMALHIQLMQTPEMREAYHEAYWKVRYGKKR